MSSCIAFKAVQLSKAAGRPILPSTATAWHYGPIGDGQRYTAYRFEDGSEMEVLRSSIGDKDYFSWSVYENVAKVDAQ